MAISENRLDLSTITKLTKINFETDDELGNQSSKENINNIATSTSETNSEPTSIFSKIPTVDTTAVDKALSMVGNEYCDKLNKLPKTIIDKKHKENNNRSIDNNNINIKCKEGRNLVDNMLTTAKPITNIINILSDAKDGKISDIISREIKDYNTYVTNPELAINLVKASLLKTVSMLGGNIADRLELDKLINGCSDRVNGTMFQPAGFDFLKTLVLASLVDMLICIGAELVSGFLQEVIGFNSDTRELLVSAVYESLKKDMGEGTKNKILLIRVIKQSVPDNNMDITERGRTHGMSDKILDNLDKDELVNSDNYDTIIESLDYIDTSWKKDSNNEVNFYKVKNNKNITKLAIRKVLSKTPTTPNDNNITTLLTNELMILAVSNRKQYKCI